MLFHNPPVNVVAVVKALTVGHVLHVLQLVIKYVGHLDLREAEVGPVLDPAIVIESVHDSVDKVTDLLVRRRLPFFPASLVSTCETHQDLLGCCHPPLNLGEHVRIRDDLKTSENNLAVDWDKLWPWTLTKLRSRMYSGYKL